MRITSKRFDLDDANCVFTYMFFLVNAVLFSNCNLMHSLRQSEINCESFVVQIQMQMKKYLRKKRRELKEERKHIKLN